MKKNKILFGGIVSLLILVLVGCTQKMLLTDIQGTWGINKYTSDDKDLTKKFDTTFIDFKWIFNADKTYSKTWKLATYKAFDSIHNTYGKDTAGNTIVTKSDTLHLNLKTEKAQLAGGSWVLINSNKYLQTRDSLGSEGIQEYHINSHSAKKLELSKGFEVWDLSAK